MAGPSISFEGARRGELGWSWAGSEKLNNAPPYFSLLSKSVRPPASLPFSCQRRPSPSAHGDINHVPQWFLPSIAPTTRRHLRTNAHSFPPSRPRQPDTVLSVCLRAKKCVSPSAAGRPTDRPTCLFHLGASTTEDDFHR